MSTHSKLLKEARDCLVGLLNDGAKWPDPMTGDEVTLRANAEEAQQCVEKITAFLKQVGG